MSSDIKSLLDQVNEAAETAARINGATDSDYVRANARDWYLTLDQLVEDIKEVLS